MTAIFLAPLTTPVGLMERLFLHETRAPGYGHEYVREQSLKAMQLMRQVVENRLKTPQLWGAPGAKSEIDIIKVKGQFGIFSLYPNIPAKAFSQIQLMLHLANGSDSQSAIYAQHLQDAITAATEVTPPVEFLSFRVTAWRTAGRGSPGPNFRPVITVQGNTFFAVRRGAQ